MSDAVKKFNATIPKVYNPSINPVMKALILALAKSDDNIALQIQNAKDQNFVKTASGSSLEDLGNSVGVSKPPALGLSDEDFRNLIPNLSLKPKQIRKSFYDTADVFWGPLFSRANVTSNNVASYNLNTGDIIKLTIDGKITKEIKILAGNIAIPGFATAEEVVTLFSRIDQITVIVQEDALTGDKSVNVRTNTPGPTGSIEFLSSTGIGPTKLDFSLEVNELLDLDQRVMVYQINNNELLIEIPAIVPALRRTLKGSHHFHADETLEGPVAPANGVWQGSFLFNPSGSVNNFTITSQRAQLNQVVNKGSIYTSLAVTSTSSFQNTSGFLVFNFGMNNEETPVKFRGIPNSNTILIDPGYTFKNDHAIGSFVNVISQQAPYVPNQNGKDLAIYLTSPSAAREEVEKILRLLTAAGIIIRFVILGPKYKYLIDSPYISSDDAPSE